MQRNVGKKKPGPTPSPQDETVRLLEDISQTLNEILEVLKQGLEQDEQLQQQPQSTVGGPP